MDDMGGNPWNRSNRPNRSQRARVPPAERNQVLTHLPCRQISKNGSPHEPSRTTNDASVKVLLMTGFRRSRRSSDKRTQGMLTCRIVVDPPVRSKTDKSSPRQPLTRSRSRPCRGDNLSGDLMPLHAVSSNQAPTRSLSPSSAHPLTRHYHGQLASWLKPSRRKENG